MNDRAYAKVQARQKTLSGSSPSGHLLQRTCACGGSAGIDGLCTRCPEKQLTLSRSQRAFEPPSAPDGVPGSSPAQEQGTAFNSAVDRAPRFAHDFSRIPIHPPAARVIQTKLPINQPGDEYEQEADRISEQIMRMPESQLQRACFCGGAYPTCQTEQPDQGHERLQTRRVGSGDLGQTAVLPIVNDVVHSSGVPLDPAIRPSAEAWLGFDFSRVHVHADGAAARSAHAAGARAYTVGSHIAFARGEYQTRTPEGRRLILHELVHVAQQGRAADTAPTAGSMTQPHDASEREAHAVAGRSGVGTAPPHIVSRLGPVMARFDAETAERQEERSEALRHGLNPDESTRKPLDAQQQVLREAALFPQLRPPESTLPGDPIQQADTLPAFDPAALWYLPRIQERMKTIAVETEAREREAMKSGGEVTHTAKNMMRYW